ncbi:MAG: hypothetical protein HC859_14560 [Bacteroidia bacterium]|nr:hypothetical protein [Bacteroidia bacterium]
MKIINRILLSTILTGAVVACDDDSEKPQAITTEEAAEIMATSVASNSSGVASVFDQSAEVTSDAVGSSSGGRIQECGFSQNLSLSGASPIGSVVQFSYDFSYKFLLACNGDDVPTSMKVNLSYSGMFDGPQLTTEHTGTSELTVEGLEAEADNFSMNGYYKRSGSFEWKDDEPKSGSGSVDVTVDDVAVEKATHKLASGTVTVNIEGTVAGKGSYSYTGTVTFDGTATATLNVKGTKFAVNLTTGVVEKK